MFLSGKHKAVGGLLLAAVWTAGCGSGEGVDSSGKVSGTVIVDGSSTVFRISKAAQEAFEEVNSEVTVVVDNHGTGGGFSRYLEGEVDIVDASRNAEESEAARARAQGIDWTRFLVGNDGITLVVNPKNSFVNSLTVDQIRKMWEPGSTVRTWKDVDPSWPNREIVFYSPDNDSGTFEFFTEAVLHKKRVQREGVQQSADDNTLVSGVAGDEDGIGYFGYAYYKANQDKLKPVGVQNGADAKPVSPSPATIADQSYKPLSRPLYLFVKNSAARRPEVKQFLTYYLENIEKLAVKGGYNPPTIDDSKANKEALARLYGETVDAAAKEGSAAAVPVQAKRQ